MLTTLSLPRCPGVGLSCSVVHQRGNSTYSAVPQAFIYSSPPLRNEIPVCIRCIHSSAQQLLDACKPCSMSFNCCIYASTHIRLWREHQCIVLYGSVCVYLYQYLTPLASLRCAYPITCTCELNPELPRRGMHTAPSSVHVQHFKDSLALTIHAIRLWSAKPVVLLSEVSLAETFLRGAKLHHCFEAVFNVRLWL